MSHARMLTIAVALVLGLVVFNVDDALALKVTLSCQSDGRFVFDYGNMGDSTTTDCVSSKKTIDFDYKPGGNSMGGSCKDTACSYTIEIVAVAEGGTAAFGEAEGHPNA